MSLGDGVGRGALVGAAIGFILVGVVVMAAGHLGGLEPSESVGVGVVAAVWGGPGFGGLLGAIIAITRNERATASPRGDDLG